MASPASARAMECLAMDAPVDAVTSETIAQCERLIRPFIRRTPVVEVDGAEFGLPGHTLTLKLELLQHSGSFKARGAFANLLTRDVPQAGVVAASGGNHGAAADQAPDIDTLLVSVGGGGLIAGIAAWYAGRIKVIGVEPLASPTLTKAFEAGHPVDAEAGGLAADSLAPRRVGEQVFPIVQKYARQTVLVSDAAIADAQAMLWRALRIVAEPGGAAAFSAILSGAYQPAAGERVAVVICGGN